MNGRFAPGGALTAPYSSRVVAALAANAVWSAKPIARGGAPTTPIDRSVGAALAANAELPHVGAAPAANVNPGPVGAASAANARPPFVGAAPAANMELPDAGAAPAANAEPPHVGAAPAAIRNRSAPPVPTAERSFHGGDLRSGRVSIVGQMYLVTTVTHGRRPLFEDPRLARVLFRALRDLSDEGVCATHAYVLMPDHVHWLVTLAAGTLSGLIARAKSRSAREINVLLSKQGAPVWQRGFHDHALRRDEDVREIARYVVANPVRAGIVSSVRNYPWWDAEWV